MPPKQQGTKAKPPAASKSSNAKGQRSRVKQPKQPAPVLDRIKRLFGSLCAQIDGGHFPNALKTCNKILRLDPTDVDARNAKLFLLLQTEQYTAALELLGEGSPSDARNFERAYAYYRIQREEEAADVLGQIKGKENDDPLVARGVIHLEAQLGYRQGSYESSLELYNELLDTAEPNTEEHSDVLTNLTATQTHQDFISTDYLRALDALPPQVVNALEETPPPQPTTQAQTQLAGHLPSNDTTAAKEGIDGTKPKSPRKSRLPKGVVLGVTPLPDPERWLRKSERTIQPHHKKKRGGGGGGATQGSVADAPPSGGGGGGASGKGGKGKKKK
ncbi:hypothetical protein CONPUDRAFT_90474 [Coniophora puteana RWD-64-598 SS2]|uniref:Signal recognition particle subunit SRP72 n=1 Tax=Coniophora puteana (strain RWD-64-598) TaxID=741705 RepID=A0A5M3MM83_CONPW|nr:uncharacterized protein CONPUDRAFT_90474 [Coniophora puteana RWD-64-598 SS2]EIW80137.1 hypothetical protein CONPUDRAFT_90474 [Coniophora puteana RWD-64-598 SS2]